MKNVMILAVAALFVSCSSDVDVRYEVSGSCGSAYATFTSKNGGTSQEQINSVPWSKNVTLTRGDFVYLSAQNGTESGSVSVSIYQNGKLLKSTSSTGAYCIAQVDGTL